MAPDKSAQIVVIDRSHAGLELAQAVLSTMPAAKVTIISTSKEYYFNIAAPRLLARPSEVSFDQVLVPIPIERLFRKYPSDKFTFVHASVTCLNPAAKSITTDTNQLIKYDYLVIATGSHTPSVVTNPSIPIKQNVTDTIRDGIPGIPHSQKVIADAKRIVIGSGGPVGLELAGEISDAYPSKPLC
jgi:NADH dehydrogenase FAD-containing subunit